jgi:putative MFS transporter
LRRGRTDEVRAFARQVYGVTLDPSDGLEPSGASERPLGAEASLKPLFRGEYLRRMVMCATLYTAVVVPLYAILTYLPILLKGFAVDADGASGLLVQTGINSLVVVGSAVAMVATDRWGRRPLAVVPLGILIAPLMVLGLWADAPVGVVVAMFCAYKFFSGGPSILTWIYPNELFPTEYRATAMGVVVAISRIGAAAGTYLVPWSIQRWGVGPTMLAGAAITAVAFVVCLFMAPETKGRSLEQTGSVDASAKASALV